MRYGAIADCGPAGEVDQVFDMRDTHHPLVEDGHVFEEFVELDILLGKSSDQIVIVHAGKCQYRQSSFAS